MHVRNLEENVFSTLILGSVFSNYVIFYGDLMGQLSPHITYLMHGQTFPAKQHCHSPLATGQYSFPIPMRLQEAGCGPSHWLHSKMIYP